MVRKCQKANLPDTQIKGASVEVPESLDEFSDIQVWGALEIFFDTKHLFKKQALKNFGIKKYS